MSMHCMKFENKANKYTSLMHNHYRKKNRCQQTTAKQTPSVFFKRMTTATTTPPANNNNINEASAPAGFIHNSNVSIQFLTSKPNKNLAFGTLFISLALDVRVCECESLYITNHHRHRPPPPSLPSSQLATTSIFINNNNNINNNNHHHHLDHIHRITAT